MHVRGSQQGEPVRASQSLRTRRSSLQRPPRGGPAGRDLPPRAAFGRVRARQPTADGPKVSRRTGAGDASVVIDCFPSSVAKYGDSHRIVVVDVIRATTLAVTAVAAGRRCLVATGRDDAMAIRQRFGRALLSGELAGDLPEGFDMNNSPADLDARTDIDRPLIMVSSSGAPLMIEAGTFSGGA